MQIVHKFRIPAILCAFAVLLCELIAHPIANMGICDDGAYIPMAQKLAATGHVVYNGWAAPLLLWQLYLAAAFIKLFGFSFTTVRMSTILTAMVTAFLLQRILVRSTITERNATIATLALVLSPLYLLLSATFMSDIFGLFAVVICLYGCLRALQSSTDNSTIAWLCFAVATNALFGTSRQNSWLGILVMVPSALWLLRAQRRVFIAGAVATLAGVFFILACLHWLNHQPYLMPEHLLVHDFKVRPTAIRLIGAFLDMPLLLLPILALFFPQIRKSKTILIAIFSVLCLGYLLLALYPTSLSASFPLEPTLGGWVDASGVFSGIARKGDPPAFLHTGIRVLLTIASFTGLLCFTTTLLDSTKKPLQDDRPRSQAPWKVLGVLLAPFTLVYILLLIPRAGSSGIYDRYLPTLLVVALLCLVRLYQDRIRPELGAAGAALVAIMALYGMACTHNTFALYRARLAIASELHAAGIDDTSVDSGWEYNIGVELQHANHINNASLILPANAYTPTPPPPAGACEMWMYDPVPHIHPLYAVAFNPNVCYGLAAFSPVHFSRWPFRTPGTLYVVRTLPAKQ